MREVLIKITLIFYKCMWATPSTPPLYPVIYIVLCVHFVILIKVMLAHVLITSCCLQKRISSCS